MSANSISLPKPNNMRPSDLIEVMEMENANYDFPWTEGIFRDCIKAGYTLQALRLDGTLVGYGVMQMGADEAHILNLCIDNAFNRRGYARFLLRLLLDLAQRAGAHTVFLEARPSVPRAIRLYEQAGFNEVGLRPDYYDSHNGREDAIVMAKSITS